MATDCGKKLLDHGLTAADIGGSLFDALYLTTGDECFKPFLKIEQSYQIINDIYFYPQKNCRNNCNGYGICVFGRCTCHVERYGDECQY